MSTDDDHYIPNERNAHIDTSDFESSLLKDLTNQRMSAAEIVEHIYNRVFSMLSSKPKEPNDDQLICRYLSPSKFLQFLESRQLNFPMSLQFSDPWECSIPDDYNNCVYSVLADLNVQANSWDRYFRKQAATWKISCWTQLEEYYDDHLLWDVYSDGPHGVGITVRYGIIREFLQSAVKDLDLDGQLQSGRVNYDSLSLLPFNKHFMFRNEKEVRFAFRSFQVGSSSISIDEIYSSFGARISPAANTEHYEMIRNVWLRFGGEDRVQCPR